MATQNRAMASRGTAHGMFTDLVHTHLPCRIWPADIAFPETLVAGATVQVDLTPAVSKKPSVREGYVVVYDSDQDGYPRVLALATYHAKAGAKRPCLNVYTSAPARWEDVRAIRIDSVGAWYAWAQALKHPSSAGDRMGQPPAPGFIPDGSPGTSNDNTDRVGH